MCDFKQPFIEREMYSRPRVHLRIKEMVPCPFPASKFKTNVYSTYKAYKCREQQNASDFDLAVVVQNVPDVSSDSDFENDSVEQPDDDDAISAADSNTEGLAEQLQFNLAAFILKMLTILHVSQRAIQGITEHIDHLFSLFVLHKSVTPEGPLSTAKRKKSYFEKKF